MQPQFITLPKKTINRIGERFGRLVVLGPVSYTPTGRLQWLCLCDCGQQKVIAYDNLRDGHTNSCGCIHREQLAARNRKHGLVKHPLYGTWSQMIMRCINPNTISYPVYGSRGICVCQRWIESFPNFLADVSLLPDYGADGYTLDRIDNDGNYEPGNVRWASHAVQRRNSHQIRLITYQNRTQCLADWEKEMGFRRGLLRLRLDRLGWTVERAFTTPVASSGGHAARLK